MAPTSQVTMEEWCDRFQEFSSRLLLEHQAVVRIQAWCWPAVLCAGLISCATWQAIQRGIKGRNISAVTCSDTS